MDAVLDSLYCECFASQMSVASLATVEQKSSVQHFWKSNKEENQIFVLAAVSLLDMGQTKSERL